MEKNSTIMRSIRYIPIIFASLAVIQWGCTKSQFSSSQPENDDMYFASTDRQQVLYEITGKKSAANQYSDKDVNPVVNAGTLNH